MLLNEGVSVTGKRLLKPATVRLLRKNWMTDKRCVDKPIVKGWTHTKIGWTPLGHVMIKGPSKGAMYMGGMSYWFMDPRRKLISAIMTETYTQVEPLNWKEKTDSLEEV